MVDSESIDRITEQLKEALENLQKYEKTITLKMLEEDREKCSAVLHELYIAVQSCIDIGAYLISKYKLQKPSKYREIFEILGRAKYLDENLSQKLAELVSLRNILAHIYWEIDLHRIYNVLQNDLWAIKEFLKFIAKNCL